MFSFLFIVNLFFSFQKNHYKLIIELVGNENNKGNYHVALYTKKEKFPSVDNTYKNLIQEASKNSIVFEKLPEDVYAFAIFHDENNNGILDKNIFGVPIEKYAFSNNSRGTFSSPSFNVASFKLNQEKKMKIYLK
jgi:uncharacterized protein (DUF2141 family)